MKEKTKPFNVQLIKFHGERPLVLSVSFIRLGGSVANGLFLAHLLYWWKKGANDGKVYKTIEEFERETTLSRGQQLRAIRHWKSLGVIEVHREGTKGIRHFTVLGDNLNNLWNNFLIAQNAPSETVLIAQNALTDPHPDSVKRAITPTEMFYTEMN